MSDDDPTPDAADLLAEMAAAVEAQDYELAARLRDRLQKLGAAPPPGSKIRRQTAGRMGIGTDQQVYAPPKGWTAPALGLGGQRGWAFRRGGPDQG
jgi:hypothetical protein